MPARVTRVAQRRCSRPRDSTDFAAPRGPTCAVSRSTSWPQSRRAICRRSRGPSARVPTTRGRTTATPPTDRAPAARGRLYVGTSGFAYPDWSPRFYPRGLKGDGLLRHYAERLPAVELNNTFYQSPSESKVATWVASTPDDFRFSVKAQRGGSWRAFGGSPDAGLPWLTDPYRHFGERLGTVLFRAPDTARRDDARLRALLDARPRALPPTPEF